MVLRGNEFNAVVQLEIVLGGELSNPYHGASTFVNIILLQSIPGTNIRAYNQHRRLRLSPCLPNQRPSVESKCRVARNCHVMKRLHWVLQHPLRI